MQADKIAKNIRINVLKKKNPFQLFVQVMPF